jgi:hypothetical protein
MWSNHYKKHTVSSPYKTFWADDDCCCIWFCWCHLFTELLLFSARFWSLNFNAIHVLALSSLFLSYLPFNLVSSALNMRLAGNKCFFGSSFSFSSNRSACGLLKPTAVCKLVDTEVFNDRSRHILVNSIHRIIYQHTLWIRNICGVLKLPANLCAKSRTPIS